MAIALLAGLVLVQNASAQNVPWFASGTNAEYTPATGDYAMEGIGLHTGRQSIQGNVVPVGVFFPSPGVFFEGTFAGSQTVTAANGDTIEMDLSGDVLLLWDGSSAYGDWYPNFTITGGTGRFANASGNLTGVATNPPFDPFTDLTWPFDCRHQQARQRNHGADRDPRRDHRRCRPEGRGGGNGRLLRGRWPASPQR